MPLILGEPDGRRRENRAATESGNNRTHLLNGAAPERTLGGVAQPHANPVRKPAISRMPPQIAMPLAPERGGGGVKVLLDVHELGYGVSRRPRSPRRCVSIRTSYNARLEARFARPQATRLPTSAW